MNAVHPASAATGVGLSLAASALFALLYYYASLLSSLGSWQVYGWRIAMTFPLLTLFLLLRGQGAQLRSLCLRMGARPALWVLLPLSSLLLGVQLWLFVWAPIHGHALDVSLGYFLLPLTLVLTGRLFYRELLSRWKLVASLLATIGVAHELTGLSQASWPVFVVALGFPAYYMLRRHLETDNLAGLWLDMALSLPVALYAALGVVPAASGEADVSGFGMGLWLAVLGLGLVSTAALLAMIAASQSLPLALFGLLSYVEPLLLVAVAVLIGERIDVGRWPTYLAIWAAVMTLCTEALVNRVYVSRLPSPGGRARARG
ncbi:EamA family transporter RarD [Acidovorax sp. SDU_ACID1]|uniref:EamA family transporter RarD n=1 Tax=Acidovorax sp. SDU_ACID1 TaxID=3136632 RepID=UPI003872F330